jgi:hypothetical protein
MLLMFMLPVMQPNLFFLVPDTHETVLAPERGKEKGTGETEIFGILQTLTNCCMSQMSSPICAILLMLSTTNFPSFAERNT